MKNDYTKKDLDAWVKTYWQKCRRIEEAIVGPVINSTLKIAREKSLMDQDTLYTARGNCVFYINPNPVHENQVEELFLTIHETDSCYPLDEQAKRIAQIFNDLD